jgi:hypothetical protein
MAEKLKVLPEQLALRAGGCCDGGMKQPGILARLAAALVAAVVITMAAGTAHSQNFGAITLGMGESRTVSIGPTFRDLRVCNDATSAGQVVVKIGSSWDRRLSPGQCAQDRGNMIALRNGIRGTAKITYRSLAEPSSRWYD